MSAQEAKGRQLFFFLLSLQMLPSAQLTLTEWLVCRSGTLAGPTGLESTEPHQGGVGGTQKAREMGGKLPLSHCNFSDLYFNLG